MLTFLFWVAVIGGCCFVTLCLMLAAKVLIDAADRGGHVSGDHVWAAGHLPPARHALVAAMNVPGPVASAEALGYGRAGDLHVPGPDLDALPPAPAGPGTLLPVYGYSGRTENQRQLLWSAVDDLPHLQRAWSDDTGSFAAITIGDAA